MTEPRPLASREALYAALPGDYLLWQLSVRWAEREPAYAFGGAVAMHHLWGDGSDLVLVGDADDALALARWLRARDEARGWLSGPQTAVERLVAEDGMTAQEGWAFRWTETAPPVAGDAAAWLPPEADGEVAEVLAKGFPDASLPVGHPEVRRWAGVRRDGRLVAVTADATRTEGGLGFLASIASHPDARGTGAGFAVTAWTTARLVEEHGRAGLWHMAHNTAAIGIYDRLAFHDEHRMGVASP